MKHKQKNQDHNTTQLTMSLQRNDCLVVLRWYAGSKEKYIKNVTLLDYVKFLFQ